MNANEGLVKTYTASGAIGEYKLVKFGATDKTVLQASTGTDKLADIAPSILYLMGLPIPAEMNGKLLISQKS